MSYPLLQRGLYFSLCFKRIEFIVTFLFLIKIPIIAATPQTARPKLRGTMGTKQLEQEYLEGDPAQSSTTPQSETKAQSEANIKQTEEGSKSGPTFDVKVVDKILEGVCELKKRPDLQSSVEKIQETLQALSKQTENSEDATKSFKVIQKQLEEIKTKDDPVLQEVKDSVKHVEELMEEIKNKPSEDYGHVLEKFNTLLKQVKKQTDEEDAILEKIRMAIEEIKKLTQIDNTEALKIIERSLDIIKNRPQPINYAPDFKTLSTTLEQKMEYHQQHSTDHILDVKERIEDIKTRPALNSDFDNLMAEVHTLLEMVNKEDTNAGNLAAHLIGVEAILEKRPGLNINRDELFDRLKRIEKLIHDRPVVNQKGIFERFEKIQAKVDTMDFAGVFNDLNFISADVKTVSNNVNRMSDNVNHMSTNIQTLVNRPAGVTPNECREMIQGVHNNIDEVKHNPLLSSNKPLVTQEHFDRTMGPMIVKINDLSDARERGQAILDVVHNVHHGIQESNRRPAFDVRPFTGLSKQLESYHNDDQLNYESIHARLDEIVQEDGSFGNQVKAMRSEFKEALESNRADREIYQEGMEKKLDVLTKIAGGALIVSVLTAGSIILWKFSKKKAGGNEKSQAVSKKNVGKRLYARSWNVVRN